MLFFNKFSILLTLSFFCRFCLSFISRLRGSSAHGMDPTDRCKQDKRMYAGIIALSISRFITPSTHQRNLVHNICEVTFMSRSRRGFLSSYDDYSLVKIFRLATSLTLHVYNGHVLWYTAFLSGISFYLIQHLCYFVQRIQCIVFLTFEPKLEYET